MKKSLLFMLAVLCCIFTALTFTACAEHVHKFSWSRKNEKYLATPATCTEKATYYFSCICGEKGTATFEDGDVLGHDVGNWNILKEPTDTEKGFKTRKCMRAGCEYFENREIPVLHDHVFTNYISDNNATCEKDGTKTATCDFSGCDETDVVTIKNSKLPHTFNKQVATEKYLVSPATCTQNAKYYYSCDCGKAGTETFEHGRTKAHSVVIDKAVKATATADGLTEGKHCSVCGTVLVEQKVVYATGSVGLQYLYYYDDETGTETCSVMEIGTCTDVDIIIPKHSSNGVLVTSIDNGAFSGCTGLKSMVIPDSVTSIGEYAFKGCMGLKSIVIPDSVTSIGEYAFSGCSGLTSIVIPDSVTSIGSSAFV